MQVVRGISDLKNLLRIVHVFSKFHGASLSVLMLSLLPFSMLFITSFSLLRTEGTKKPETASIQVCINNRYTFI